jgi:hypothetical protein
MKAKGGFKKQKAESPNIGNWLKFYVFKRTCRKWKRNAVDHFSADKTDKVELS